MDEISLIDLLKKNPSQFDIFSNNDEDDCKSKYNYLIYYLIHYIELTKKSKLDFKTKLFFEKTLEANKEAILLYLNLAYDVINNQNIDSISLSREDLSYIKDLKGNLDFNTLDGKKLIINQIRNAFAHKSGNLLFFIENGQKKVKISNKNWFSIEVNVNDLNRLFQNISYYHSADVQGLMQDLITKFRKRKYSDISYDSTDLLLENLLFCFNKESIFDQFMATQTSFIDASKFDIRSTSGWNLTPSDLKKRFFEKYRLSFPTHEDKASYENEWKEIVDIDNIAVFNNHIIYDSKKMPYDSFTGRHIPIPIFLNCLRNAICHGRIKIDNDIVSFFDKDNSTFSKPHIYMRINKKDLYDFLHSDYFMESILTDINQHNKKKDNTLYTLEVAEAGNSFDTYVDIFRNHFPNLSEEEIIKYMYDNNKFSSYLLEFPKNVDDFLEYRMKNGAKLIDYLCTLEKISISTFMQLLKEKKRFAKMEKLLIHDGVQSYIKYAESKIVKDIDRTDAFGNYHFFILCHLFSRNLNTVKPNININKFDLLDDETREEIFEGARAQESEFNENIDYLEINDFSTHLFTEIGIQKSKYTELEKILLARFLSKQRKNNQEERFNIKNIEKNTTIAGVYSTQASEDFELAEKRANTVGGSMFKTIIVRAALTFGAFGLVKANVCNPFLIVACYVPLTLAANTVFNLHNLRLVDEKQKIKKARKTLDKYSNAKEGVKNEDRSNGQHHS